MLIAALWSRCISRPQSQLNHLSLRSLMSWTCPSCGTSHDRDLNAAINILNKGLDDLYGLNSKELLEYRRGEEVRPIVLPKASSVNRLASFITFDGTA